MCVLDPLSRLQECRGQGRGLACVPVPCVVPSCPGPLPTAQWALVISHNASYSLDTVIAALEQHRQLVQSDRGCGWEPWRGHGGTAWPSGYRGHVSHLARPSQLQQTQATASSAGIQARETWHRARGPWGVASTAAVQATVHRIRHFLLGTCLLVCLFPAEGWPVGIQAPAVTLLPG